VLVSSSVRWLGTVNEKTSPTDEAATNHLKRYSKLRSDPRCIVIYSDGSQRSIQGRFRRVGAAAVGYYRGEEVLHRKIGLGGMPEVYDAELAGMALGLKAVINKASDTPEISRIHIFADNAAAIGTIHDPKPRQRQLLALSFYKDMVKWLESSPNNHISIAWCPGHKDIPTNERADELAKEAVRLSSRAEPTTTYNLRHARETITTCWRYPTPNPSEHYVEGTRSRRTRWY
jgi:ribonuclease HI